jgi:hypothetical protein
MGAALLAGEPLPWLPVLVLVLVLQGSVGTVVSPR